MKTDILDDLESYLNKVMSCAARIIRESTSKASIDYRTLAEIKKLTNFIYCLPHYGLYLNAGVKPVSGNIDSSSNSNILPDFYYSSYEENKLQNFSMVDSLSPTMLIIISEIKYWLANNTDSFFQDRKALSLTYYSDDSNSNNENEQKVEFKLSHLWKSDDSKNDKAYIINLLNFNKADWCRNYKKNIFSSINKLNSSNTSSSLSKTLNRLCIDDFKNKLKYIKALTADKNYLPSIVNCEVIRLLMGSESNRDDVYYYHSSNYIINKRINIEKLKDNSFAQSAFGKEILLHAEKWKSDNYESVFLYGTRAKEEAIASKMASFRALTYTCGLKLGMPLTDFLKGSNSAHQSKSILQKIKSIFPEKKLPGELVFAQILPGGLLLSFLEIRFGTYMTGLLSRPYGMMKTETIAGLFECFLSAASISYQSTTKVGNENSLFKNFQIFDRLMAFSYLCNSFYDASDNEKIVSGNRNMIKAVCDHIKTNIKLEIFYPGEKNKISEEWIIKQLDLICEQFLIWNNVEIDFSEIECLDHKTGEPATNNETIDHTEQPVKRVSSDSNLNTSKLIYKIAEAFDKGNEKKAFKALAGLVIILSNKNTQLDLNDHSVKEEINNIFLELDKNE